MRRAVLGAAAILSAIVLGAPAWAITFGQPDGGRHPYVGALMAAFEQDGEETVAQICTGTLLPGGVFLTAGHCVSGLDEFLPPGYELGVSFAEDVSELEADDLIGVTSTHAHPAFGGGGANPGAVDVGVAVLETVPAIQPAALAPVGLVDSLDLRHQWFTPVGYGVAREDKRTGPHSLFWDGLRRFATQTGTQANASWLKLSMNPSTGDGGTCFGDSGGPHVLGAGATETKLVVSVTSWGERWCRATDWTARVDTRTVHDFVAAHTPSGG